MRFDVAPTRPWLLLLVAVAVAMWMLVAATQCLPRWFDTSASDHPHALSASAGDDIALVAHAHVAPSDISASPEAFAAAILPRVTTVLMALGVIATVVALSGLLAQMVAHAMRGPPRMCVAAFTGQHVLTQLCIARR